MDSTTAPVCENAPANAVSPAARPRKSVGFADVVDVNAHAATPLNTSTTSSSSESFVQTDADSTTDSEDSLALIAQSIDDRPRLIRIFETSAGRFASFFDVTTGELTTKRLSRKWRSPPCAPDGLRAWFEANVAFVLTASRGPEQTPARPPMRAPPVAPEAEVEAVNVEDERPSAVQHELNRLRTELHQLRERAPADAEVSFAQGFAKVRASLHTHAHRRLTRARALTGSLARRRGAPTGTGCDAGTV